LQSAHWLKVYGGSGVTIVSEIKQLDILIILFFLLILAIYGYDVRIIVWLLIIFGVFVLGDDFFFLKFSIKLKFDI